MKEHEGDFGYGLNFESVSSPFYFSQVSVDGREMVAAIPSKNVEIDLSYQQSHPLLFLHSEFGGSWLFKSAMLPWFASRGDLSSFALAPLSLIYLGFSSFSLSYRGHGESEGKPNLPKMQLSDFVEDLSRAIESVTKSTGISLPLYLHLTNRKVTYHNCSWSFLPDRTHVFNECDLIP